MENGRSGGGVKGSEEGYCIAAVEQDPGYLQDTGWGFIRRRSACHRSRVRSYNSIFPTCFHNLMVGASTSAPFCSVDTFSLPAIFLYTS